MSQSELEVVAFNQSNYPVLIEVYEVNEDYVRFASNLSKKQITSSVRWEQGTDRAYFRHYREKYYLDETMVVQEVRF